MLKKVIIGLISFILLVVIGAGIYIYTLDWNKHKTIIAQRFSQITGLNAVIEGNLTVELFPTPKFSAGLVRFYKNGSRDLLMNINQISSNVELMPLFDNKFILKSMTLTQPKVNLEISEKGVFNWSGFGASGKSKSGNIEVSFNDIRMADATFKYSDLRTKESFELTNISANISAPSLQGPYKTNGMFIHNNSEIKFNGDIVKNDALTLKMTVENASTSAKVFIDGTIGSKAKGNFTFETKNLTDTFAVIFGKDALSDAYKEPLYFSFKYDYDNHLAKLDNFTVKYGQNTVGTGSVLFKNGNPRNEVSASFDMTQFNTHIIENISHDFINMVKSGKKFADTPLFNYDGTINIKASMALVKETEAQNLNLGLNLKDGVLDLSRFGLNMIGDTSIKAVGRIDLNNGGNYQFNQIFESKDLRTFASVFGIDLAKLANPEQKKSIFKRAQAEIKASGDLNTLKISIPSGVIDATSFRGNFGFIKKDGEQYVLADVDASQILFDKYFTPLPKDMATASLEEKALYQLNLIEFNKDINFDVTATIGSAVYNEVPLEKMQVQFGLSKDNLMVKKFNVANMAGGAVNLSFDADKIYSKPYFKELSFEVKTNNFPLFSSTLGIKNLNKPLFKRKLFATQGALSGTFDNFSLSSVQKFGDTEFSYTGTVENAKNGVSVNGDLELKSNNFSHFIKALDIDYTPDIPLTSFVLNGKIKGTDKLFSLDEINAYLGANNIKGRFDFDYSENTPKLAGEFDFDKFDADRLFNLNKKATSGVKATEQAAFISPLKPDEKKIDYLALKKADFNLALTAKQLIYKNKNYTGAKAKVLLKNGVLKADNFSFEKDDMSVLLTFMLDSNNIAKAEGNFSIKGYPLPWLGGSVYMIEGGVLNAEGSFNSLAGSPKDFLENLNAKGKFDLSRTAIKGWDLDIIKFEFEQRKTLKGFEEVIANSLKTGRSVFDKISGTYNITKGLLISENTLFQSPVAELNMKFDLDLNSWLFNAVFNGIYHNATFSDVLKFSYVGDLSNPQLKLNLSESIKRISDTETMLNEAKNSQEKAQKERLEEKSKALAETLNNELQDISRLTLDIIRFKPVSNNENIAKIYDASVKTLQDSETKLKNMAEMLRTNPNEEALLNLGAELEIEKSKIKFVPKTLEDNFIVDSKYIFDNAFNKISWLYNAAQNNASYYSGLSDVYMQQVGIMAKTDTPVDEAKQKELQEGIDEINDDIERINGLYNKIRDNYLNIIDSQKISEMKKNNEIAQQALNTIFVYTERMNNKIIDSIEDFRGALNINARDYDEYMVYLPQTVDEIDASKPTSGSKRVVQSVEENTASDDQKALETAEPEGDVPSLKETTEETTEDKKKDETLSLDINGVKGGIANLIKKIKTAPSETTEVKIAELAPKAPLPEPVAQKNPKPVKEDAKPTINEVKNEEEKSAKALEAPQPEEQKVLATKPDNQEKTVVAQKEKSPLLPIAEKKPDEVKIKEPILAVKEKDEVKTAEPVLPLAEKDEVKTAEPILPVVEPTNLLMADNTVKQTLVPTEAQTLVASADETQTVLPTPVKTALDTLIDNTKSAMNDIMAKIKHTESEVKPLFIENEESQKAKALAYKQQFPSFKKELSGDFFGKNGAAQNNFFKTNPVIALGIGKDENSLIATEIANSLSRKQGFLRSKNIPAIALSSNNLAFHITAQENAEKENALQSPLIKLLSDERLDDDFAVKLSNLTDDVPVYIETSEVAVAQNTHNKYVFNSTDGQTLPFSGKSGKSALKDENAAKLSLRQKNKYLFAQNQISTPLFSGEISKAKTLYVK